MGMMRRSIWGSLAFAATVLTGCVVTVEPWTPIGSDASATGSWTVNGQPASPGVCDAAGVNSVALRFSDGFGASVIPPQFVFDCADGGFNLPNVLAAGTYTATWIIDTNTGAVTSDAGTFTVSFGDTANFSPIDITTTPAGFNPKGSDFTMDGMWTINGGPATTATCAAAGISNVQLVIQQAGETYTEPGFIFSCAGGAFDTRTLTPQIRFTYGNYMTFWRALDATGANIGMSSPLPLVVGAPITHSTLATADFVVATPESLTINLTYDTVSGSGVMADTDCAGAGVSTIFFTLRDVTGGLPGTVVRETTAAGIACTGQLVFDNTVVMGGRTYGLYIEGANAAGLKQWMAGDNTLSVSAGTPEFYNIALDKI
jgi:hypothetical protein